VRPEDVRPVLEAGGAGVAVVSGILGSADVEGRRDGMGELMGVRRGVRRRSERRRSSEFRVPSTSLFVFVLPE
jgi:hypothetical protein